MSMPIEPPADDRAERMAANPRGYFADARQRAEAAVARPTSGRNRRKAYPRPTPGVVRASARAVVQEDLDRLIDRMRACGFTVRLDNGGKAVTHDDRTLCLYFSVEVPEDGA